MYRRWARSTYVASPVAICRFDALSRLGRPTLLSPRLLRLASCPQSLIGIPIYFIVTFTVVSLRS